MDEYQGPTAAELIEGLFHLTSCSYRVCSLSASMSTCPVQHRSVLYSRMAVVLGKDDRNMKGGGGGL